MAEEGIPKMARPKGRHLPNRVSVALSDQQFAALERLAQTNQAAMSWLVRQAITSFLERNSATVPKSSSEKSPVPIRPLYGAKVVERYTEAD